MNLLDKRFEGFLYDSLVLDVSFKGLFYTDRFAQRPLFHGRLFDPIGDPPEPDPTFAEPVGKLLRGYLAQLSDRLDSMLLQEFSGLLPDATDLVDRQRLEECFDIVGPDDSKSVGLVHVRSHLCN